MKKHLKWFRRMVVAGVVLVVAGGGVLGWLVPRFVTKESLVRAVEEELNARVEIGDVRVRTWWMPARLVLRNLKLGPRDEWVGKPLSARPPLEGAPVAVGEVRVAVALGGLLRRRIEVKEFVFEEPRVEMTVFEDGGNSLEALFRSPDREKQKRIKRGDSGGGALNVHEVGVLARLEGVAVRMGSAIVTIEKSGLVLGVSDWAMELDAIEIDPEALETMNTARLGLAGTLTMDAVDGHRYGVLDIDGVAEARLFDMQTGDFAPDLRADLLLGETSYLSARIPAVHKTWSKVEKLANYGLDLGGFPDRATFGRSESVAVAYVAGRVSIEKPLSMWFGDWELALLEGTWIQTGEVTHAATGELVASEAMSGLLDGQLKKALGYVPNEIRSVVVGEIEKLWFRDGRLLAEVVSEGDLSDPDVTVLNTYPDLTKIVKEAGEQYGTEKLEDLGGALLKKFFGKD